MLESKTFIAASPGTGVYALALGVFSTLVLDGRKQVFVLDCGRGFKPIAERMRIAYQEPAQGEDLKAPQWGEPAVFDFSAVDNWIYEKERLSQQARNIIEESDEPFVLLYDYWRLPEWVMQWLSSKEFKGDVLITLFREHEAETMRHLEESGFMEMKAPAHYLASCDQGEKALPAYQREYQPL